MPNILAIYGSPRRKGNTARLLDQAVTGAENAGASVETIVLRDLKMSPCLEIYGCKKDGRCIIKDDFQAIYDKLLDCDGIMLASPIFFYTVSAHTKILMDRCQSLWVKKHWLQPSQPALKKDASEKVFLSLSAQHKEKNCLMGHCLRFDIFLSRWIPDCGGRCYTGDVISRAIF